jgi:hypothetical protein
MASRKIVPELLDYSQWPTIDAHLLAEPEALRFSRLSGAIKAACDGVKSGEIERRFGVSRSLLHYHLAQCTSDDADGRLRGWRALTGTSKRNAYVRSAELKPGPEGQGLAGAFGAILREYPTVKKWLNARLKPDDGTKFQAAGLDLALIHQDFLTKLRKAGRRADEYPFTTKRHGYESLCAYVRNRIAEGDDDAARLKFGDQATARAGRNSGKTSFFRPIVAFERAAYDEYRCPEIETLPVVVDIGEEIELPLSRSWFCLMVDFKTAAVLGWTYSVAGRFRALDLLQAFEHAIHPPPRVKHPVFDELLKPFPGEGLPAAVIPAASGRRICSLAVDNHLTHLANSVVIDLRRRSGVSISFGKVHSWIQRSVVEGIFAEFQRVLTRLASTTGSGPSDSRVRDPVEKAVRYKIRAADVHALFDRLVARHNDRRKRALMSATPNEAIAAEWADSARLQIVPKYPRSFVDNPCIAIEMEWPHVRGSRKDHRTPYIQLDEVEYTNDLLRQSWGMLGEQLCVHIRGDFRTVRAFRADGTEFGVLHVSGVWAISAHTREVRKEINKLYREAVFKDRSDDPVAAYQRHLAGVAVQKVHGKRRPKITREASKLARSLSVPGSVSDSPDFRYECKAPKAPTSPQAKPRGRRAFFTQSSQK